MSIVAHSQNLEDALLWRALGHIPNGRYLDVGAQDPVVASVSLVFYEAGWRGVNVEPIPFYASRFRAARPDDVVIEAAVTDAAGPVTMYELRDTWRSMDDKGIAADHRKIGYTSHALTVPSIRLDELLDMAEGDIHWLKIDVEGMEANVLRSWGESPVRPWVLVIEAIHPGSQEATHQLWIDEVLRRDYREVLFDGSSRFFVHHMHDALVKWFSNPPNLFDEFAVTHSCWAGRETDRAFQIRINATLAEASVREGKLREAMDRALAQAAAAVEQLALLADAPDQAQNEASNAIAERDAASLDNDTAFAQINMQNEHLRSEALLATLRARSAERSYRRAVNSHADIRRRDEEFRAEIGKSETRFRAETVEQDPKLQISLRESQTRADKAQIDFMSLQSTAVAQQADLLQVTRSLDHQMHDLRIAQLKLQKIMISRQRAQWIGVNDLLAFRGSDFIEALYVHLLSRTPEAAGMAFYVNLMASGVPRPAILLDIHKSALAAGLEPRVRGIGFLSFQLRTKQSLTSSWSGIGSILRAMLSANSAVVAEAAKLQTIDLQELLALNRGEFVFACYRKILSRDPDPVGLATFRRRIDEGTAKTRVIGDFAYSAEGKTRPIRIEGLRWRYALAKIYS